MKSLHFKSVNDMYRSFHCYPPPILIIIGSCVGSLFRRRMNQLLAEHWEGNQFQYLMVDSVLYFIWVGEMLDRNKVF